MPVYNQSILRAKESVLRQDLFQLRSLISQYTLDKQKAPQSLEDLVTAGYLKQLPADPTTGKADWEPQQEDVHSRSINRTRGLTTCIARRPRWGAMGLRITPGSF